MGAFFVYILKASVYLAILYLFYSILLSKETFYRYNRTALLLLIPLSLFFRYIRFIRLFPKRIQTLLYSTGCRQYLISKTNHKVKFR